MLGGNVPSVVLHLRVHNLNKVDKIVKYYFDLYVIFR
jgi:hypothetical protein